MINVYYIQWNKKKTRHILRKQHSQPKSHREAHRGLCWGCRNSHWILGRRPRPITRRETLRSLRWGRTMWLVNLIRSYGRVLIHRLLFSFLPCNSALARTVSIKILKMTCSGQSWEPGLVMCLKLFKLLDTISSVWNFMSLITFSTWTVRRSRFFLSANFEWFGNRSKKNIHPLRNSKTKFVQYLKIIKWSVRILKDTRTTLMKIWK